MQNLRLLFAVALLAAGTARAQDPAVIRQYIATYKDAAMAEMQRSGVPAAIKLAQGIHETGAGTSQLVLRSNNHFGIKCKSNWTGPTVSHTDDAPNECFRKYDEPAESYKDHSDFLRANKRYASLFELDPTDYAGWANGLKKAGYATNPKYPAIIIRLVETYHLQDYTLIAMGRMQQGEELLAGETVSKPEVVAASTSDIKLPSVSKADYPQGEFRINETRVVFVSKGTPALVVAQEYHVPLKRLFEFNDMIETEQFTEDCLIYLQRKRKVGLNDTHTVAAGEKLTDIARSEAIRLDALLEYNHLTEGMQPAVGEQLYLRKKSPGTPRLAGNTTGSQARN